MERGDLVLVRGRGRLSRLIRKFTQSEGESPTRVTHVAIAVSDTHVVEALAGKGVVRQRYSAGQVYRHQHLTLEARERIAARAESYLGRPYGWGKIFLHAIGLQRLARLNGYPICSFMLVAFQSEGVSFGRPAQELAPDDADDFVQLHPETWQRVHAPGVSL